MKKKLEHDIWILLPEEGKILTNGRYISEKVYLGKNADESEWYEIDEAEMIAMFEDEFAEQLF